MKTGKRGRLSGSPWFCGVVLAIASYISLPTMADVQAEASWTPVAFGAYPIVQCPERDYDVTGFRFNLLAGRHRNVVGFDMGVIANICDGSCSGFEFSAVCNVVGDSAWAVQFSAACNYSSNYSKGFQFAMVNWSAADFAGVQLGLFNFVGDFSGLQMGLLNSAESGGGVQFGLVNVSGEFAGVQFGLLNINLSSGVPVLPLMNVMF